MEREINKLEGVNSATVNFMMQKLTIDAVDESFNDIMISVQKIIKKFEPDCTVNM